MVFWAKAALDSYMKVCWKPRFYKINKCCNHRRENIFFLNKHVSLGVYVKDNRTVAIKFSMRSAECQREFEMYNYLKAYKDASVERYGIPVIYYYGRWNNFILTAMTKLDIDLVDIANDYHKLRKPLDVLLLIRNFVSFSKIITILVTASTIFNS